ncbi:hypothetical protein IGK29_002844 [Enterococcus sp. AZ008]
MSLQTVKFYLLAPILLPCFILGAVCIELLCKVRTFRNN